MCYTLKKDSKGTIYYVNMKESSVLIFTKDNALDNRACERSVQNIVGARSRFLSKGWSDRSVSLWFRSDTAHTTSLGHAQIHSEFTCAFNN